MSSVAAEMPQAYERFWTPRRAALAAAGVAIGALSFITCDPVTAFEQSPQAPAVMIEQAPVLEQPLPQAL
ncbi:MAG TPA: hypothetical protein VMY99_03605 [Nevskiaceae bacterium]|nr:hypothetical protein [Nevskiaceae bacterium]